MIRKASSSSSSSSAARSPDRPARPGPHAGHGGCGSPAAPAPKGRRRAEQARTRPTLRGQGALPARPAPLKRKTRPKVLRNWKSELQPLGLAGLSPPAVPPREARGRSHGVAAVAGGRSGLRFVRCARRGSRASPATAGLLMCL